MFYELIVLWLIRYSYDLSFYISSKEDRTRIIYRNFFPAEPFSQWACKFFTVPCVDTSRDGGRSRGVFEVITTVEVIKREQLQPNLPLTTFLIHLLLVLRFMKSYRTKDVNEYIWGFYGKKLTRWYCFFVTKFHILEQ